MSSQNIADSTKRKRGRDELIGSVVNGKFRILSVIATGGMGKIYKAEQLLLNRPAAIKIVSPRLVILDDKDSARTKEFRMRFLLEASTLSKLQHHNIVTVYDYGPIQNQAITETAFFMAMEYLEGVTLAERLRHVRRIPPETCVALAFQIARGLREAHRHGVIHRDLKPSNIMLTPTDGEEVVKLLDFGLVKLMSQEGTGITETGVFLGSPTYIAPEQVQQHAVDVRTDVYSLGIIMYECLSGLAPFTGDTVHLLGAHVKSPPPPLTMKYPDLQISDRLKSLIYACLEKKPDKRPQSMDNVIEELRKCEEFKANPSGTMAITIPPLPLLPSGRPPPPTDSDDIAQVSAVKHLDQTTQTEVPDKPNKPSKTSEPSYQHTVKLMAAGFFGTLLFGVLLLYFSRAPSRAETPHILVESQPAGADIIVDNKFVSHTPHSIDVSHFSQTTIHIVLKKQGYVPYSIFHKVNLKQQGHIIVPLLKLSDAPIHPPPSSPSLSAPSPPPSPSGK
jgi:eukaryotic-like serine/threonine-protein kinase